METLDQWYTKFAKRPELTSSDFAPIRRNLLDEALAQFRQLDQEAGENPRLQRSLIMALIRVSQIESEIGDSSRAVDSIREAIHKAESWFRASAPSLERGDALVKALHWSEIVETDFARVLANMGGADQVIDSIIPLDPARATATASFNA